LKPYYFSPNKTKHLGEFTTSFLQAMICVHLLRERRLCAHTRAFLHVCVPFEYIQPLWQKTNISYIVLNVLITSKEKLLSLIHEGTVCDDRTDISHDSRMTQHWPSRQHQTLCTLTDILMVLLISFYPFFPKHFVYNKTDYRHFLQCIFSIQCAKSYKLWDIFPAVIKSCKT